MSNHLKKRTALGVTRLHNNTAATTFNYFAVTVQNNSRTFFVLVMASNTLVLEERQDVILIVDFLGRGLCNG